MSNENRIIFQFNGSEDCPIFVSLNSEELDSEFINLLNNYYFKEVPTSKHEDIFKKIETTPFARMLNLTPASMAVKRQLGVYSKTDFGNESVGPKGNYSLYRYRGMGMMIFSLKSKEWEMGIVKRASNEVAAFRSMITRYLSYALAPFGIVGFWGVPVDSGLVIFNQGKAEGEAVFIDIRNDLFFSLEGAKKIKNDFQIMRLQSGTFTRNVAMKQDEFLCFLSEKMTYLWHGNITPMVKLSLVDISNEIYGVIVPEGNFRPRTDLSL